MTLGPAPSEGNSGCRDIPGTEAASSRSDGVGSGLCDDSARRKTCKDCGESKALTEFYRHQRSPDGRRVMCKTCERSRRRAPRDRRESESELERVVRQYHGLQAEARLLFDDIWPADGLSQRDQDRVRELVRRIRDNIDGLNLDQGRA